MKKIIIAAALLGAAVGVLAIETNEVVAATLFEDGTTNVWTAADLQAALGLLNRKYHREVRRPDGRRAWHGELVRQVIDTNNLQKIEI